MSQSSPRMALGGITVFIGLFMVTAAVGAGVWAFRDQVAGKPVEVVTAEEPAASPVKAKPRKKSEPATSPSVAQVTEASTTPVATTVAETAVTGEMSADAAQTAEVIPEVVDAEASSEPTLIATASTPPPPVAEPGLYPAADTANAAAHICFFSFNNPTEYHRLKQMLAGIAPHSPIKITVQEYIGEDERIAREFKKVLDSNIHCDGVVLSGHHTDEFYGDRSSGDIDTDFFEELSCDPRYANWFANVKALWLAGCKTAQSSLMNKEVDEKYRISNSPLAAFQARMDLSDPEDSLEEIQDILEENLDDENVVNGYSRAFPSATIFGWSYIAPGEKAGSDRSIPYHIAQLAHILNPAEDLFAVNPMSSDIPPKAARHYSAALYGMLRRPSYNDSEPIPGMNEKNFLLAWRRQGDFRYKWALDNPDLRAYGALLNDQSEVRRQLRGVNCLLNALDEKRIPKPQSAMQIAEYALSQPQILPYATYTLEAMLRKSGKGTLANRMRDTPRLSDYLRRVSTSGGYRAEDAQSLQARLGMATTQAAAKTSAAPTESAVIEPVKESEPEIAAETSPAPPRVEKLAPVVTGTPASP